MPRYRLTKAAERDLTEIYRYTTERYGTEQAEQYFSSLEARLMTLTRNPQLGRDVSMLRQGYRRLIHQHHAIYYLTSAAAITIVRILGPGMSFDDQI